MKGNKKSSSKLWRAVVTFIAVLAMANVFGCSGGGGGGGGAPAGKTYNRVTTHALIVENSLLGIVPTIYQSSGTKNNFTTKLSSI